ncbi:MAG: minichromosome maintenance protein MCM [Methanosphaera sp.]|nr:minichromosome maintenance protein MCM [Methanosphaera sp.]
MEITKKDVNKIKRLSKDPKIHNKLLNTIAPTIKGYYDVKEAILLSLFMGSDKQLEDGTNIRRGINILIIHDPSTGMKTLLKNAEELSVPNKLKTVYDINEVKESVLLELLDSDDSFIALGAPIYGRFDKYKILIEQVGLHQNILSKFDLIFLIEDKPDRDEDTLLADHILSNYNSISIRDRFDVDFFKKYLTYSNIFYNPSLGDDANEVLKEFYVATRNSNPEGYAQITVKQLEAIIRLAEASAKIKFKKVVDKEDAEKAVRLQMACLKEVGVTHETGEIDANITSIKLKSDRDKIQRVTEEIKLHEEEYAGDAPLNLLLLNMDDKYGVGEDETTMIVSNLISKGVIFKVRSGYYRRVR